MPTHVLPELARPQDHPLFTLTQLRLFRENKFQAQTQYQLQSDKYTQARFVNTIFTPRGALGWALGT